MTPEHLMVNGMKFILILYNPGTNNKSGKRAWNNSLRSTLWPIHFSYRQTKGRLPREGTGLERHSVVWTQNPGLLVLCSGIPLMLSLILLPHSDTDDPPHCPTFLFGLCSPHPHTTQICSSRARWTRCSMTDGMVQRMQNSSGTTDCASQIMGSFRVWCQ